MGSGVDPNEASHAIFDAIKSTDTRVELLATNELSLSLLKSLQKYSIHSQVTVKVLGEQIRMDEPPVRAVLDKPGSTLVHGVQELSRGAYDALITLGSTGSAIAAAKLYLPPLATASRPFLLATIPSQSGTLTVADVGGTVNPRLAFFRDIALFSIAFKRAQTGDTPVRFGLLNIGEEATKGTGVHQKAFSLLGELANELEEAGMRAVFKGNIEPVDAFSGPIDVLITDGFTGNIFLKTAEGAARYILSQLKASHGEDNAIAHEDYPGALVAGIDKIMIKCHSYSSGKALQNGIEQARSYHKKNLLESIRKNMLPAN
ncbi:Phosphate acyltransferase [Estrella lausannensis]|uniref:Phosphate acyltransferase n=2 Tax=Estrella lausannensis TaxID=483423 RepID=A0A0H5E3U1_9BACT|nr:Phosphate acyltransferase [Estrella lausannensis]